jgi:hypothetical protein
MPISVESSVSSTAKFHINDTWEREALRCGSVLASQFVPHAPKESGQYRKAGNPKGRRRFWQGPDTRQK